MQGNNLSNKQAPYVMFDIDSLLFTEGEKKPLLGKIGDFFKSVDQKYLERPVNKEFANLLNVLWHKHNICIGLVTFTLYDDYYIQQLSEVLDKNFIPYTQIFSFFEWEELRKFPFSIYNFSANDEMISYLSDKNSMHIGRIREVL